MTLTRRAMIGATAGTLGLAALPRVARARAGELHAPLLLAEAGSRAGALGTAYAAEHGWETRCHDLAAMLHSSEAAVRRPLVGVTNYAAFVLAQDLARTRRARMAHAAQVRDGTLRFLPGTERMRELAELGERLRALSAAPGGGTMLWAMMPA